MGGVKMNNYLDGIYLNAVTPVKKVEQSGLFNNKYSRETGINFQKMIEEESRKSSGKKEEVRPSTPNQNLDYAYIAMASFLVKKDDKKI